MNKDHIYKRRLLKLADFLFDLPKQRFDFYKWVGPEWKGKPDLSCGTTACALGWATTIPSLRKAGLRLKETNSPGLIPGTNGGVVCLKGYTVSSDSAEYAAHVVFGLSTEEFEFLFIPADQSSVESLPELKLSRPEYEKMTPKKVAKRIRHFVKAKYKK